MNALAHRIAGGTRARRRAIVRPPRAIQTLTYSLLATAGLMTALQRLADRIG